MYLIKVLNCLTCAHDFSLITTVSRDYRTGRTTQRSEVRGPMQNYNSYINLPKHLQAAESSLSRWKSLSRLVKNFPSSMELKGS